MEQYGAEVVSSPSTFFFHYSGVPPYKHQTAVLHDDNRNISVVCGRQVGKSTAAAFKALFAAVTESNHTILIIAPTYDQSSILFWKIKRVIDAHASLRKRVERETLTSVRFRNGSEIVVRTAGHEGASVRGYSASMVIVDEAALVPEAAFEAFEPTLAATGGQLILIGTPYGCKGKFYKAAHSPLFSKHKITSVECPGISKAFLETQKEMLSEVGFRQEYLAEFVALANQFFTEEEVMRWLQEQEPIPEGEVVMGVDLARYGEDRSVYIIAVITPELHVHVLDWEATSKKPLTDAVGRVKALTEKYKVNRVFVDETGLGSGVVDVLKETEASIYPITFTLKQKHELYQNAKWLSDTGRLHFHKAIPPHFFRELVELEPEYSSTGYVKVAAPEGGHDDFPSSMILACWAAKATGGLGKPLTGLDATQGRSAPFGGGFDPSSLF